MNAGRRHADDGSILPLAIFYGVLCIVVVFLASSVTSLYLERERLFALADAAALAGAEAYDLHAIAVVDGHPRPPLHTAAVRDAVADFVASAAADGFDALRVRRADTEDSRGATVTLSAEWHPPIVSIFVPTGIRIDVTSRARSVFQ